MKEIIESFVGVFFLMLLSFMGISIVAASMDVNNATSYETAIVTQIEESDFAPGVINSLGAEAVNAGYTLKIRTFDKEGNTKDYVYSEEKQDTVTSTDNVYLAKVVLTFDFSFKFVNAVTPHSLTSFAQ